MLNYSMVYGDRNYMFVLQTISMQEIQNTIFQMKTSQSAGSGRISTKTIKSIEMPLLNMINCGIEHQVYLCLLKESKVIPLYKVANPPKPISNPDSYIGINLVMSIGNIIDKTILKQKLHYLIENNLVHQAHCSSTTTDVAALLATWTNAVEKGEQIAAITLDQSSAYELIDHPLLLSKMTYMGFQPTVIQ